MAKKSPQRQKGSPQQRGRRTRRPASMVFSRRNYILLLAGLAVIIIGYVMMRVENEVDGILSLYVAPLLILAGYLEIIYAISYQQKQETDADNG